jgi:hypothetical protein
LADVPRDSEPVTYPFAQFLPEMSLATISLNSFCFATLGQMDPLADIRHGGLPPAGRPFVRFANERYKYTGQPPLAGDETPDFFGLCESDWRSGLSMLAECLQKRMKNLDPTDGDTVAGPPFMLLITLLCIFDPKFLALREADFVAPSVPGSDWLLSKVEKLWHLRITGPDKFRFLRSVLPASIRDLIYIKPA